MMKKLISGALAAATLGGAALTAATPAAAQPYRYGGWHHGGGNGAAIGLGAGLLGLAVGASLASPHYYAPRPYYGPGYAYGYGGYYGPGPYGYYGGCRSHWRFDPYIGREVLVRRCY